MGKPLIDSIPCPVREVARITPDRTALIDNRQTLSYSQLDSVIDGAVPNLKDKGVTRGDIVAVLGGNSLSYAVLFFAAFRFGFTLMPLNTRLSDSDWRRQLSKAACRLLVCGNEFSDNISFPNAVSIQSIINYEGQPSGSLESQQYDLSREALIIHSSGSSGESRGVVLTWRNLYYSAQGVASALSYKPEDCWLAVLPFFHIGGISILLRVALAGCATHIISRFDPEAVLENINDKNNQFLSVVPTMLCQLIDKDSSHRLENLKAIVSGGAPLNESLRNEIIARGLPVLTTYGMTETSSMVTLLHDNQKTDSLATTGKVLPFRELMITDDTGNQAPPDKPGKILVRGEVLFSRYLNHQETVTNLDGWFETRDIGWLDEKKRLTVVGRADRIIISGGENIDLDLIEQIMENIVGVTGAVVLGYVDDKWGERPIAFATVSDDQLSEKFLKEELREGLASMMIPDKIIIVESLPLTGSGKYDRQAIRQQYCSILNK